MQIFFLQLGPYSVPPGSLILLSSYTMAMDPTIFYKPDLVLPGPVSSELTMIKPGVVYVRCICSERWERGSDGEARARQAFATLPFGHGPRGCIGGWDWGIDFLQLLTECTLPALLFLSGFCSL